MLLALAACAENGEGAAADPARAGAGAAETAGTQEDAIGAAGMAAPAPRADDDGATGTDSDPADGSAAASPGAAQRGQAPMADDGSDSAGAPEGEGTGTDDGDDPVQPPQADDDAQAPVTSPPPMASTPTAPEAPAFTGLADLAPSPNNIPECPATAPENPWGPCVGVPVYAVCDYGTQPAPYYTCVCDWIHWICVGFQ